MRAKTNAEAGAGTRKMSRAVIAGGSAMALGGMSLAMGATPAEASHDHDHPSGVLNSTLWHVCQDDAPSFGSIIGVNWAVALYDSLPELTVVRGEGTLPECASTATVPPNVTVLDEYGWPADFPNFTICRIPGAVAGTCNVKWIGLNASANDGAPNPAAQWKKVACQEFGHLAGLGNRTDTTGSCMAEGFAPPVALTPDAHDVDAIAATY